MKKSNFLLIIVGIIIISAIVLRLTTRTETKKTPVVDNNRDDHGCLSSAGYTWCEIKQKCLRTWEEVCAVEVAPVSPALAEVAPQATFTTNALIKSPLRNELVTSPLKVEGQVGGAWFFEGSLPIKLVDNNDQQIVAGVAVAEDDWMTDKPVRFSANLVFSTKATSGYVILSKDNPSGLAANSGFIRVPVKFK